MSYLRSLRTELIKSAVAGLLLACLAGLLVFPASGSAYSSTTDSIVQLYPDGVYVYGAEDAAETIDVTYGPSSDSTYNAYTVTVSVDGAAPDEVDDSAVTTYSDGQCTSSSTKATCSIKQSLRYETTEPDGVLSVGITSKDTVNLTVSGSFSYYDGSASFLSRVNIDTEGDDNQATVKANATFPSGYSNPLEVGINSYSSDDSGSCGGGEKFTLSGTAGKWSAYSIDDCNDYFYAGGVKDRSTTFDIVDGTDTDPSPTDKISTTSTLGKLGSGGSFPGGGMKLPGGAGSIISKLGSH